MLPIKCGAHEQTFGLTETYVAQTPSLSIAFGLPDVWHKTHNSQLPWSDGSQKGKTVFKMSLYSGTIIGYAKPGSLLVWAYTSNNWSCNISWPFFFAALTFSRCSMCHLVPRLWQASMLRIGPPTKKTLIRLQNRHQGHSNLALLAIFNRITTAFSQLTTTTLTAITPSHYLLIPFDHIHSRQKRKNGPRAIAFNTPTLEPPGVGLSGNQLSKVPKQDRAFRSVCLGVCLLYIFPFAYFMAE